MTEQEIRVGQLWRRVKGVRPGTLVRITAIHEWFDYVIILWRSGAGGGDLLERDFRSRYEFVKEESE